MKPYKVLDIAAVVLVVGFLSYAGVVFLKPEAAISQQILTSESSPAVRSAAADHADYPPAAGSALLAERVQTGFSGIDDMPQSSGSESDVYISSSHADLIEEARQSLPALAAPGRSPSGSSGTTGTSSAGSSSSSGSSLSGGSSGSGGGGSAPANTGSKPRTGNGAGTAVAAETEKPLPEWITPEGIRAGFFNATSDADYNRRIKAVGMNTSIPSRFLYTLSDLPNMQKDYRRHAQACAQLDMHMFAAYVWQPGNEWKTPRYRSVVFSDGSSGLFPCPLDETFWHQYLINIAVEIAKVSVENSCTIDGIFLDMEMYGTGYPEIPLHKRSYSESTCFCDSCFSRFIIDRTQFTTLPPVSKEKRKSWLSNNGFLPDYYTYLGEQVEVRAELLKNSVHAINPEMLFGVYPALHKADWVRIGIMRAFGRNSYPVISFSTDTYGYYSRPWGADRIPADLPAYFEEYNIHGAYAAGYMFCKYTSSEIRQYIIKSCERAQGYWFWDMSHVFEAGLEDKLKAGNREIYLQAIKNANMALGMK